MKQNQGEILQGGHGFAKDQRRKIFITNPSTYSKVYEGITLNLTLAFNFSIFKLLVYGKSVVIRFINEPPSPCMYVLENLRIYCMMWPAMILVCMLGYG